MGACDVLAGTELWDQASQFITLIELAGWNLFRRVADHAIFAMCQPLEQPHPTAEDLTSAKETRLCRNQKRDPSGQMRCDTLKTGTLVRGLSDFVEARLLQIPDTPVEQL